ncbi:MAG: HAMP domain-containing sensor histidine kinase [Prevotellaceae bacterium]|nr:HAMP domain-containing histidine kinase [Prevotella sp.]MDD7529509.1 HAMP domain-containing sensor histidine kinase [Prevotellaceae bacterium]
MTHWLDIVLILALIVLAAAYLQLRKRYRRNIDKIGFMFNALDVGDYTFRFPEEGKKSGESQVNSSLNRVKAILQHARDEQIEREKYFELILDSVDTGILVVDEERGIVLRSNRAALDLLHLGAVTHINQTKEKMADFSTRETHTVIKNRRVRIIGFSDIKGELANQEIDSWVKLIRVLTHEIMNTVTPIISLSDTLLKNSQGEQRTGLQVISQTGKDLVKFVENYRKFTHVPTPSPRLFYVKPFLQRMTELTKPLLKDGVDISIDIEPHDLLAYSDEGLVSRVVSNILKNAAEAVDSNGHIGIHAYTDAQEAVTIDISNDGEPIPDDVASHIFVPFFTTKNGGSGIGLSISRQIMRACNGSLVLLSDKKTKLTTFRLTFN